MRLPCPVKSDQLGVGGEDGSRLGALDARFHVLKQTCVVLRYSLGYLLIHGYPHMILAKAISRRTEFSDELRG